MRPKKAADELSFYFFVLSQLSVEMRRRSSLRKVLTPRLCLSLVTIRTICVLILTESLLRHDSDDDPYFTYTPILLLLHTLIWYILCNRKTQWHPPQHNSPLQPPVTGLWWAAMSHRFYAFVVIFMSAAKHHLHFRVDKDNTLNSGNKKNQM